jgi:hypothetical protein
VTRPARARRAARIPALLGRSTSGYFPCRRDGAAVTPAATNRSAFIRAPDADLPTRGVEFSLCDLLEDAPAVWGLARDHPDPLSWGEASLKDLKDRPVAEAMREGAARGDSVYVQMMPRGEGGASRPARAPPKLGRG